MIRVVAAVVFLAFAGCASLKAWYKAQWVADGGCIPACEQALGRLGPSVIATRGEGGQCVCLRAAPPPMVGAPNAPW